MRLPLLLACLLLAASSVHASDGAALRQRMTAEEFRAAGLEKLSADELARLDAWLAAQDASPAGAAAPAPAEDRRGLPAPVATDDSDIVSRIPGNFRGWSGAGEVITLENGQRWRIVQTSGALVVNVNDPVATISPAAFGSWSLRIEGYNARAKVRRVE